MLHSSSAIDSRVRRTARRAGLVARKSRWRADSIDNWGEYMLVDPTTNFAVAGSRYDMTAEEILDYCKDE
jgi:hypothetical protein